MEPCLKRPTCVRVREALGRLELEEHEHEIKKALRGNESRGEI
jgi:hypothetical protein